MTRPVLDWRSHHDPRSRNYPIRAVLDRGQPRVRRLWKPGVVLDQGSEGACVGFAWTGELLASPERAPASVTVERAQAAALSIYRRAQVLDEWPGEDYSGSSVLAGAKACVEAGHIEGYRWAFSIDDVRGALMSEGPVVIGVPWFASMYSTGPTFEVQVDGEQVGGHCILLTGYDPAHTGFGGREMFRWTNSWGTAYGRDGNAWLSAERLAGLLEGTGEACVPMGRRSVRL